MDGSIGFTSQTTQVNSTPPVAQKGSDQTTGNLTDVKSVPFLEHTQITGHPLTAEYYQIESVWNNPEAPLKQDVEAIEGYIKDRIESGELANDSKLIKEFLKKCEKEAGVEKLETKSVRLAQTAAYINYLAQMHRIKKERARYAIS